MVGDIDGFYSEHRWNGWEHDIQRLHGRCSGRAQSGASKHATRPTFQAPARDPRAGDPPAGGQHRHPYGAARTPRHPSTSTDTHQANREPIAICSPLDHLATWDGSPPVPLCGSAYRRRTT